MTLVRCEGVWHLRRTALGLRPALRDLTLDVASGEIVAVVGVPASGKTTLLRVIAGLLRPDRGHVSVDGVVPTCRGARSRVGYVRAGLCGPPELTATEWLHYVAAQRGGARRTRTVRVQAALTLVALGREAGWRIGTLDRDAAERVGVATAALGAGSVLLLDECFAGVRTETRRLISDALADLALQGRAIIVAPRDAMAVEGLATRVIVMRDGRVVADLAMPDLQRERVAELMLDGGALRVLPRLLLCIPEAVRTGSGIQVPLTGGRTLESILAACRDARIPVRGSRIRYRAVEDLVGAPAAPPDPVRTTAIG
jgi:ABC-type multidrug transport system ATPase subunit